MADLSKVLSLNQERANSMESKTLKTRTKVNTVRGRPAVRELYERSIYERTIMSERSISRVMQYQISYLLLSYVDWSGRKKKKQKQSFFSKKKISVTYYIEIYRKKIKSRQRRKLMLL